MSNFTRFGMIIAKEVENGSLPCVMFTHNADLNNSLDRLATLAFSGHTVEPNQVVGSIESFSRVVGNKVENDNYVRIFENIAKVLSDNLNKGKAELHKTKRLVSKMCSVLQDRITDRYSADAVLSAVTGSNKPMTLHNIAWEVFNIIDERNVRGNVNLSINHDVNENITEHLVTLAIYKLPGYNKYQPVEVKKIELEDSKFTRIIDVLHSRLPNIDHSHIIGIVKNILELDDYTIRGMLNAVTNLANGKRVAELNKFMRNAAEYAQVLDNLKEDVLDISRSLMDEYNKHAEIFNHYVETILYIASYWRNEMWKNSILLPGGVVNTDTYSDYINRGGSMNDIVRYKNYFYNDSKIPLKGVLVDSIIKETDTIKSNIAAKMVEETEEIEAKKRTIERDCFVGVATEYLNGNKDKLDKKFAYRNNVSTFAASVYDATANLPIESRFYALLMSSCHINDMTSKLYYSLDKAYTASAESMGGITEADKVKIETAVYTDIIINYLLDSGLLIVVKK